MSSVPGNLIRDTVPAALKSHFAAVPWCMAVFADAELVPVRTNSTSPSATSPTLQQPSSFAAPLSHATHVQSFYKPASAPAPATTSLPSLTPYEPYRASTISTVGQLHTLLALSYEIRGLDAAGLEDLATALLTQQGRFLIASDSDPGTVNPRLVDFSVRLRKPLRPGAPALCRAWKVKAEGRRFVVGADLVFGPGEVLASAEMVFVGGDASRL